MNKRLSHISMVLDRSGSMAEVREATVDGFNEFVNGQKKVPGEATLSLVQFDTEDPYEVIFDTIPIREVPKLTVERFVPRGGTPLHDAIGNTIIKLGQRLEKMKEQDRPAKVFVVIMTDGYNNSSTKFTAPQIAEMIEHQRKNYNWEFIYLGANQDAILTGEALNIPAAAAMTYMANSAAVGASYRSLSSNVADVRLGRSANVSFTKEEREEAKQEDE